MNGESPFGDSWGEPEGLTQLCHQLPRGGGEPGQPGGLCPRLETQCRVWGTFAG